jgi:hypothetical protein
MKTIILFEDDTFTEERGPSIPKGHLQITGGNPSGKQTLEFNRHAAINLHAALQRWLTAGPINKWRDDKPPYRMLVSVQLADSGSVATAQLIPGGDGYIEHWEAQDGDVQWSRHTFDKWRPLS